MVYRKFQDLQLSGLGLGMMRLPVLNGNDGEVDEAAAAEMIDYAYRNGINYYDTAWGYHDGNSELVAGKYLSRYPRDSYYLASKFPGYDLSNMDKVEEIFEKQLEKCRTPYFDFYLFHNVYEGNIDAYLNPEYGILEYLLKQKENGRIRHLGFSAHGSVEVIQRFLDAYGKHMEFCQLQLNYMDWHFQNAHMGHGAAAGRQAGTGFRRLSGGHAVHSSPGDGSRLGIPFPAEHSGSNHGAVRYVFHGAAESKYCYI